jgi:hypothetical protein
MDRVQASLWDVRRDSRGAKGPTSARTASRHVGQVRPLDVECAAARLTNVREVFHGELAQLGVQLESMCAHAGQAMRQATQALLTAELVLAERVLAGDTQLDQRRAE